MSTSGEVAQGQFLEGIAAFDLSSAKEVLLAMKHEPTPEEATGMISTLKVRYPNIEFTIITGVVGIGIK